MLVRRAVSGVRSSWEASMTRRRWLSCEASSAESISLKVRASRATSSRPSTSMRRPRSRVWATSSAVRSRRRTGARPARATAAASRPARPTPAMPIRASAQRSRPRVSFTSSSGRATWTARPPPRGAVSTRTLVPSRRRRAGSRRAPRGHLADVVVHRQRRGRRAPPIRRCASRGDDLHHAAAPAEGCRGDAHRVHRAAEVPGGRRSRAGATASTRSRSWSSTCPRSWLRTPT